MNRDHTKHTQVADPQSRQNDEQGERKMRGTWTVRLAIGAAALLQAGMAMAAEPTAGLVLNPRQLPAVARVKLQHEIEAFRAQNPQLAGVIHQVKGCSAPGYENARNPKPACAHELRALGPTLVLPMLEALAFDAPREPANTPVEKQAFAAGLLRAVGTFRDPRATAVLHAAFELGPADARLRGEAAEALGRLGGDAELATLVQHTAAGDPLRQAAIQGLGECMRLESAQHLTGLLAAQPDEATAAWIARSLGNVSSSWAWQARERTHQSTAAQGLAVRTESTRALLTAYATAGQKTRERIEIALGMAEHPEAQALLLQARSKADAKANPAYDALATRLAKRAGK
jgi:hypothetical protein